MISQCLTRRIVPLLLSTRQRENDNVFDCQTADDPANIASTISTHIMRVFLFILCILSFLAGVMIFAAAKSAIHEIEAFLLFLIGAVFLVGAAIVEAIHGQRK